MKQCSRCSQILELTEYYKRSDAHGDGLQSTCKTCMKECKKSYRNDPEKRKRENEGRKKWRKNNPEWISKIDRKGNLKRLFGMTVEEFATLSKKQNDVCAICNKPERAVLNGKIKNLSVDHCHKTGKIRGLLCCACNRAIGMLSEDANLCLAAATYLKNN